MTPKDKPKGYFQFLLGLDCATTGIAFGSFDPSYDSKTKQKYQAISWGFVVANADTLRPVDELYLEIQWGQVSAWDEGAARVHGLTKQRLAKHGLTSEQAAVEFHQPTSHGRSKTEARSPR
jgi:hypothetical protein